jgi:transcriptional regulator with XRE-family HTH domain
MNRKASPKTRPPASPSGKQFSSVDELLRTSGISPEVKAAYDQAQRSTAVCHRLALLRTRAGLTQAEMGERLGISQSAVSKLESGRDEDLTLGQIRGYCEATKLRLELSIGKPRTHVESIKAHALAMRSSMMKLADIAHSHHDMNPAIQAFFGEAFFNILSILTECKDQLPSSPRIEVMEDVQQDEDARTQSAALAFA